jgi:hypothetical protein
VDQWHCEWGTAFEHELAEAYGWSIDTIEQLPPVKVFTHVVLCRRSAGLRQLDLLQAIDYAQQSKEVRQKTFDQAKKQALFGLVMVDPLVSLPREKRIVAIGGQLSIYGDRWATKSAQHLAWLASQGVTKEAAVTAYKAWRKTESEHWFWSQDKPPKAS